MNLPGQTIRNISHVFIRFLCSAVCNRAIQSAAIGPDQTTVGFYTIFTH